jgi:Na+-translocating ferredoxin:NAD+ oxidoreductase RnfG subunit
MSTSSRLTPVLLRVYRVGVVGIIVWLLHFQNQWQKAQREATLPVSRVKDFFPEAATMGPRDPETGVQQVLSEAGRVLGLVTQTAPLSDKILGYAGPTNTLLVLDPRGQVIGLRILHSDDTPDHLAEVIRHRAFFDAFKGMKMGEPGTLKPVDGVSGATLTSTAIADGVFRRLGQEARSLRFPEEITLEEVQPLVAGSTSLRPVPGRAGLQEVLDENGQALAQVTRTSPSADPIIGYKGPTDTLVVLDAAGEKVTAVQLRKSYDTKDYVGYVREDRYFLGLFTGMTLEQLGQLDFAAAKIEGVSGATETSWSVAEGLKRRAEVLSARVPQPTDVLARISMKAADWGLLVVVVLSLFLTFSPWRGRKWVRWAHHALLIGYAGAFSGAMLSQGLLVGWARHGIPWENAPLLVLLAALAFAIPLFYRRQLYCHHYCPHGALQMVLANRLGSKWRLQIPPKVSRWLERIPWTLLVAVVVISLLGLNINLNALEPFDAWLIRVAGWGTLLVAVVGLVASLFVPMAYCKYGCPTGALFKFLRYAGHGDTFGRRDLAALLLIGLALGLVWQRARLLPLFQ